MELLRISYNGGDFTRLPENSFKVEVKSDEKTDKPELLHQKISIDDGLELQAKYDPRENLTKIKFEPGEEKKQTIEKDGLILIHLSTNQGTL